MEIIWSQAVLAGLLGAALMALAMFAGKIMGLASDMVKVIGLFFFPPESSRVLIYGVGLGVHFLVGAGFGIVYAVLFTGVGTQMLIGPSAMWGILFGALHGVAIGSLAGLLPAVHPRMGTGPSAVLQAPGFFGRNIGLGMPTALILLHIIYGVTAGIVYAGAFY